MISLSQDPKGEPWSPGALKLLSWSPEPKAFLYVEPEQKSSWHTVHATEIEIDQSEFSTRDKLSFPTS